MQDQSEVARTVAACVSILTDVPTELLEVTPITSGGESNWKAVSTARGLQVEGFYDEEGFIIKSRQEIPAQRPGEVLIDTDDKTGAKIYFNAAETYVRIRGKLRELNFGRGIWEILDMDPSVVSKVTAFLLAESKEIATLGFRLPYDETEAVLVDAPMLHWQEDARGKEDGQRVRATYNPYMRMASIDVIGKDGFTMMSASAEFADEGPVIHVNGHTDRVCKTFVPDSDRKLHLHIDRESVELGEVVST